MFNKLNWLLWFVEDVTVLPWVAGWFSWGTESPLCVSSPPLGAVLQRASQSAHTLPSTRSLVAPSLACPVPALGSVERDIITSQDETANHTVGITIKSHLIICILIIYALGRELHYFSKSYLKKHIFPYLSIKRWYFVWLLKLNWANMNWLKPNTAKCNTAIFYRL